MKATHNGTCQCCGRQQKLPGGVLSKHGYTVDFGMFNGTCPGSGHLPFEQSKDQIEQYIKDARKRADNLIAEAEKWEATNTGPAWCRAYDRGVGYRWAQVEVVELSYPDGSPRFKWGEDERNRYGSRPGQYHQFVHINDVIRYQNTLYAADLRKEASRTYNYAGWQLDRIQNWKPQPLQEIKA